MSVRYSNSQAALHVDDDDGFYKRSPYTKKVKALMFAFFVVLIVVCVLGYLLYSTKEELIQVKTEAQKGKTNTITTEAPIETTVNPKSTQIIPTTTGNEPYLNIRLPKNIVPSNYTIVLDADLESDLVDGECNISVSMATPTKYIIVHADEYNTINSTVLKNGMKLTFIKEYFYKKNQYQVIKFAEELEAGEYLLMFRFTYKLSTNMHGFYKSSYKDDNGVEKKLASTQFESTDARKAFPSFDEPALKATFQLTLKHSKEYISVSNTPVLNTYDEGDKKVNAFKVTPVMSTYLVAFIICDFTKKTATTNTANNVEMSYYAPTHQLDQIDFAMETGVKIIKAFEDYYNVSYPLAKADMVAVPDFSAGAMENWGLITYRLKSLLYKEGKSSISNKIYVATVVSHELAHQWFGNIVTMDWWSDLWLNEGFASYVEYIGIDKVYPKWKLLDHQVINDLQSGMRADSLVSSHPILVEVKHPEEISEIFDGISYQKGGFVLRMLDSFLGNDTFKNGLTEYLNKHKFGNAKTKDLWTALSKASGEYDVAQIMDTWTLQMGFPVVTIKSIPTGFSVEQSRFFSDPNPVLSKQKYNSTFNDKWIIPFEYEMLQKNNNSKWEFVKKDKTWLNMTGANLKVSTNVVVKGNYLQNGFYRVNYDSEGWAKMTDILNSTHEVLNVKDRAGLIYDVFALANSGRVNFSVALDLIDYIGKDVAYLPWKAMYDVTYLSYLSKDKLSEKLKKYRLNKVTALYDKMGFKDPIDVDDINERSLQVVVVAMACGNGHQPCLDKASELFHDWMKDENKYIRGDFRRIAYMYGVRNGGLAEWDFLYKRYNTTKTASEKTTLLYGMSKSKQPWIINRYLKLALNDKSFVKDQDFTYVMSYVASSSTTNRYLAYAFLKEEWGAINARFANSKDTIRSCYSYVGSGFSTQYELESLQDFVKTHWSNPSEQDEKTIAKVEAKIVSHIKWRKNYEKPIKDWIKNRNVQ